MKWAKLCERDDYLKQVSSVTETFAVYLIVLNKCYQGCRVIGESGRVSSMEDSKSYLLWTLHQARGQISALLLTNCIIWACFSASPFPRKMGDKPSTSGMGLLMEPNAMV